MTHAKRNKKGWLNKKTEGACAVQLINVPSTLATSLSMVLGVADRLFSPACDFCCCSAAIRLCNSVRSLHRHTATCNWQHVHLYHLEQQPTASAESRKMIY